MKWEKSLLLSDKFRQRILNGPRYSFDHFGPNNKERPDIQTLGIGSSAISTRIVEGKQEIISSDQTSKNECDGRGGGSRQRRKGGDLIYADISYPLGYMSVLYGFSDDVYVCS